MMLRSPYAFPLRSRQAIISFLTNKTPKRCAYFGRHTYYPLAWNIKVYNSDETGWNNGNPDYSVTSEYDAAWEAHLATVAHCRTGETFRDLYFSGACEDGLRYYLNGYAGDCKFTIEGRSGGWLCMTQWMDTTQWMIDATIKGGNSTDFIEYLQTLPFKRLRELYRLVVKLDRDIQPDEEVSYQFNFRRYLWEQEHREEQAQRYPEAVPANFTAGAFI
ncbi:MAG: hypothetical protein KME45_26810 [Stenomitos rutilans HA7619-LM2]|jgi:hypothetical protein|nr:hypothetical protein [Stenomitos rutilans HA7619-LM2]